MYVDVAVFQLCHGQWDDGDATVEHLVAWSMFVYYLQLFEMRHHNILNVNAGVATCLHLHRFGNKPKNWRYGNESEALSRQLRFSWCDGVGGWSINVAHCTACK